MAELKPAYLIHGDDHGRIAERRARLLALAERTSGSSGVEVIEGEAATPENVAAALAAMTLALGRRFVIVDGVERWSDRAVEADLSGALAAIAPDTTIAFFGRDDGRAKPPEALAKAVQAAGGDVATETMLKAKELPRWCVEEAARLGFALDGAGAQALVTHVGERQQRLLRELEKLALEHGEGARVGVEEVDAAAAISAEHEVWGLVDAIVAGEPRSATAALLELRAQGESLARLVPLVARRVRDVLAIAVRLEAGEAPAQIKASMRGSAWAADRRIKEARSADAAALRAALDGLSQLEVATRGGSELSEQTEALRMLAALPGAA